MKLILLAALVITVLIILGLLKAICTPKIQTPYEKEALLSAAEETFFKCLIKAVPEFFVFPKIRLADIVKVKKGLDKSTKAKSFNRIRSKHIDFVLATRDTVEITWAIELDDFSHSRPDRQRRDEFVDKALNAAGIPIKHFRVKKQYNPQEIAEMLTQKTEDFQRKAACPPPQPNETKSNPEIKNPAT